MLRRPLALNPSNWIFRGTVMLHDAEGAGQTRGTVEAVSERFDRKNLSRLEAVQSVIAARVRRSQHLAAELFSDPAWDMLLHLYETSLLQQRVSITAACRASGAPCSTGLRWLQKLTQEGLVDRIEDPLDQRRTWVQLSSGGLTAMTSYFEEKS